MTDRVQWEHLPAVLRAAIEETTGKAAAAEPVELGLNSPVALALAAAEGMFFVKGVRDDDAGGRAALAWEERLAPAVSDVSPTLRLAVYAAGWRVLVFDFVPGRTADLGPGSPDVVATAALMRRLACLAPAARSVAPVADQYARYLLPGEAALLHGRHLLHTDTNPHNILVDDGTARLVDWAMPARGPAWIDPALTAVRLMEADQTPRAALAWLDGIPSWRRADPAAVSAFVGVVCRDWTTRLGARDAEPSNARFRALLAPAPR
ncbi:phosphotransferase [Streptomyces sp. NPDC050560]|uniref:phosphotransferase n=1 Tax=Streptomyces sp. NPDC050560 TaxID=3365630 RepID=UPI00379697A3